jgi:hypothetical protein
MITKIRKDAISLKLKNTSYMDYLTDKITPSEDWEHIEWLDTFYKVNNINIPEFYGSFIVIQDMMVHKINSFVLEGVSNAGKSTLIKALIDKFQPETIQREASDNQFQFSELVEATCALIEEPLIGLKTVNTYKELLGGAKLTTDRKYDNKDYIKRLPIFITTNTNIGNWVEPIDKTALLNRTYTHKLKAQIINKGDTKAKGLTIEAPKKVTTIEEIYTHILLHWEDIRDWIDDYIENKTVAEERKCQITRDRKLVMDQQKMISKWNLIQQQQKEQIHQSPTPMDTQEQEEQPELVEKTLT